VGGAQQILITPMTTPSSPEGAVKALRPVFSWALLGYVALVLFFEFLGWIVPGKYGTFSARSYTSDFVSLYTVVFPLLALLIATQISPVLTASKLLAAVALAEYAVTLFFGAITFLIGLGSAFDSVDSAARAFDGLRYIVMSLVELGFAALAAWVVLRLFLALGGTLPDLSSRHTPPAAPSAPPQEPPAAHRAE